MNKWKTDTVHSEVKFKVKHLVISTVTGEFKNFDAEVKTDNDDFENAMIKFEADVNSINTGEPDRDAHLKSADFFDAQNHPKLAFVSKSFKKISGNDYELVGDITIRGTTKEIKLNVVYNGTATGFDQNPVAGFEISGKLNRMDFGLHWNAITEAGGIVVSNEVRLEIALELKKEKIEAEEMHA
jgi:polyisoprenoid-binding protein YceI